MDEKKNKVHGNCTDIFINVIRKYLFLDTFAVVIKVGNFDTT